MRETIGWIEQEPNNGKAFFCFRRKDGTKCAWELISLECRPGPNGGGGGGIPLPSPIKVAA